MNQRFRKLEPKLLILGLLQFGLGTACAPRYQTRRLVLDSKLAPWGTDLTIHCPLYMTLYMCMYLPGDSSSGLSP